MAKWKILSWKSISIVLSIIIVPYTISLLASYTTWRTTKEKKEITLKLDEWTVLGRLEECDLMDLKFLYGDIPVNNILKIRWKVENTGSMGIKEFEEFPSITYPVDYSFADAMISQTSDLLRIDRNLIKDPDKCIIKVNDLGLFDSGDFFILDVYIIEIPNDLILMNYFDKWRLMARSVGLKIKKDLTPEADEGLLKISRNDLKLFAAFGVFVFLLSHIFHGYIRNRKKSTEPEIDMR